MSHIDDFKALIQKLHGGIAGHLHSVPVKEVFNGETVCDGVVEVYSSQGHSKANTAYVWLYDTGDPENPIKHVTVLHIPPVTSPLTALRAFIRQEFGNAQKA
jgi:hypothetical protein